MNRAQKSATIEQIAAQIEGSEAIFVIDYRGISVPQAAELRNKLREADASFRVVKNRLTKLAAERAGEERLAELLEGPSALTFVRGDSALAAKAISTFNREHGVLTFRGGFMEGLSLDEDHFKSIARLPSRDVLNGQFAGLIASPLSGIVRGLGAMISGLAIQLGKIAEQGLLSGETAEKVPSSEPASEAVGAEIESPQVAPDSELESTSADSEGEASETSPEEEEQLAQPEDVDSAGEADTKETVSEDDQSKEEE
jgi:large subunit ribosomal protein L10